MTLDGIAFCSLNFSTVRRHASLKENTTTEEQKKMKKREKMCGIRGTHILYSSQKELDKRGERSLLSCVWKREHKVQEMEQNGN